MPDELNTGPMVGQINAGPNARIVIVNTLQGDLHTGPPAPSTPDFLNRSAAIKRIRHDWIDGVLNQSLYREARIELGLAVREDAVAPPLTAVIQLPQHAPTELESGIPITEVFDRLGQSILILGTPGTGKTTIMLELAKGLLDRAESDASRPIPAVFNLSTWALKRKRLSKWLASELNAQTGVPRKLAKRWIDEDRVIPLLDGLDEMDSADRIACVNAINEFRREHGLVPIAVCSREADYQAAGIKLHLLHAIVVQQLSSTEVENYLARGGEALAPLRAAMIDSPSFTELLQTPLMLWVAILANRTSPIRTIGEHTTEQLSKELFRSFVDAMFARGPAIVRYPKNQVLSWLSWLASALNRNKQTVFHLENLNLGWFGGRKEKLLAYSAVIGTCVVVMAPVFWLGLNGGLLGLGHGWAWWGAEIVLVFAFVFTMVGGPVSTFMQLRPADKFRMSLRGIRQNFLRACLSGVIGGGIFGFIVGLMTAVLMWSMRSTWVGVLEFGLGFGGVSGAVFGPLYALFSLLTIEAVEVRTKPNQGTLNSFINALIILLVAGLSFGLACGILATFNEALDLDWHEGLMYGLLLGALVGLVSGLISGGIYAIRNVVLRLIFSISGRFPFHYVSLLDYAVSKLLMRKVGGGYLFAHRTLLEYLADRKLDKLQGGSTAVVSSARAYRKLAPIGVFGGIVLAALVAFLLHPHDSDPMISPDFAEQTLKATIEKTKSGRGPTYDAATGGAALDSRIGLEKTKHIIVVMLESSSYDRTLGALKSIDSRVDGLKGDETNPDPAGNNFRVSPNATWQGLAARNPLSRFFATNIEINDTPSQAGNASKMQGFVKACQMNGRSTDACQEVMRYFNPDRVPVLATLALEYATCDHWFSSVPGPSIPNHTFADYGSSFGEVSTNVLVGLVDPPFSSIYERLLANGKTAKIYQYAPRTFYIQLFLLSKKEPSLSSTFNQFFTDARRNNLPDYSFVEPDYDDHSDVADQEPDRRLSPDEALVARVYDVIHENRELWETSILLIVFASHGGFYDHVPPPETEPDGFVAPPENTGTSSPFHFDRLGVRVPAIIVSPYIPRGTVDHRTYDHSSIPATVAQTFLLQREKAAHDSSGSERKSLREQKAKTFLDLLQLPNPRPQNETVSFDATR